MNISGWQSPALPFVLCHEFCCLCTLRLLRGCRSRFATYVYSDGFSPAILPVVVFNSSPRSRRAFFSRLLGRGLLCWGRLLSPVAGPGSCRWGAALFFAAPPQATLWGPTLQGTPWGCCVPWAALAGGAGDSADAGPPPLLHPRAAVASAPPILGTRSP